MRTWEYLEVVVLGTEWLDRTGRSGWLSEGDSSGAICNELGAQGWGLTGVAANTQDFYRLFIKRPRA